MRQNTDHRIQSLILTLELAKIEFELAAEYPALVKSSLLCKGTNSTEITLTAEKKQKLHLRRAKYYLQIYY